MNATKVGGGRMVEPLIFVFKKGSTEVSVYDLDGIGKPVRNISDRLQKPSLTYQWRKEG